MTCKGEIVAKIFADPEKRVQEDLQRFCEVMGAGAEFGGVGRKGESLGSSMGGTTQQELAEMERRTEQ